MSIGQRIVFVKIIENISARLRCSLFLLVSVGCSFDESAARHRANAVGGPGAVCVRPFVPSATNVWPSHRSHL